MFIFNMINIFRQTKTADRGEICRRLLLKIRVFGMNLGFAYYFHACICKCASGQAVGMGFLLLPCYLLNLLCCMHLRCGF